MSVVTCPSSTNFGRTASYPTHRTLAIGGGSTGRRCSSTTILTPTTPIDSIPLHCRTLDRPLRTNTNNDSSPSWMQQCKQRVSNFFKKISKSTINVKIEQDSMMANATTAYQQSTFAYDPELDVREEHLSLVAKRLLTTLRECKIKHLSCDNLFIPCNHLRNIARQCLIMSAEEPFGIMGAQITIKLTLLPTLSSTNTTTKYLPSIVINPEQKTIFEIIIDLHEDAKVFTLRRFLPQMKMFKQLKDKSPLYVSPRCFLVKNVFYKTAEPKRAIVNSTI